ncbi:MAG: hypothetical protein JSS32_08115 [Verrucomicrobia bacterium]|nr:hypothetical protein [Verrucomicrobiota bacterium]
MTLDLIKKLQESFSDLGNLSPTAMQELIQDTLSTFQLLQGKLESKDPKDRKEALDMAIQLKEAFEEQAEKLHQSVDMDPERMSEFMENPTNFSKEEWEAVSAMNRDLKEFRNQIAPRNTAPKKKVKRSDKIRLIG